jgi:lipopolysaccharide transport system permease protein
MMNPREEYVADNAGWTTVIEPRRPWLDLRIREVWEARNLILLFVRRDFVAVYKQTILGPLWFLMQPLLSTLVFTVIFGRVLGVPSDGLPPFLFYLSGMVVWSYFSGCVTKTSDIFAGNAALFGKVYFPRLTVPISILISSLVTFGIQMFLLICFMVYFWMTGAAVHLNIAVLLLPLLLLFLAGLALGSGLIVSALTTRYRDLQYLVSFGMQSLMFVTPVIYPLSGIPEGYRRWFELNPLAPIIETFRYAFLGAGTVSVAGLLYAAGFMIVLLLVGILLFTRTEQTFMDTV